MGEPHGQDCVCIHKLIRARYTFDLILSLLTERLEAWETFGITLGDLWTTPR